MLMHSAFVLHPNPLTSHLVGSCPFLDLVSHTPGQDVQGLLDLYEAPAATALGPSTLRNKLIRRKVVPILSHPQKASCSQSLYKASRSRLKNNKLPFASLQAKEEGNSDMYMMFTKDILI